MKTEKGKIEREGEKERKIVDDVHLAVDLINSRQDDLSKYLQGDLPHSLYVSLSLLLVPPILILFIRRQPHNCTLLNANNNNNLHSSYVIVLFYGLNCWCDWRFLSCVVVAAAR